MFDLLIRRGTIVNGNRAPRYQADLAISGDRIAAIGDLSSASARRTIDAAGKIVAPGFVDVHNHTDGWLRKTPHFVSKTLQGFTTEVLMSDGISYAPVNAHTAREWIFYMRALDALQLDEYTGWESIDDYMQGLDRRTAQNAIAQIPYANVRSLACGFGRAAVDDFQMRQIRAAIRKAMEEGATGISTGLDYIVQCFSTTDELVDACSAMAPYDGIYVTHIRYKAGRLRALKEAVEIGRRAGVKVHISHLKGEDAAAVDEILEWIDKEARHQVDFTFDVYPYQPGSTMLNYLLPYEVWEDGPLAALGKLQDPKLRERFREGLKAYPLDLDQISIAWVHGKENSKHQGKLLSDYVAEMGRPAEEALYNLLVEERFAVLLVFNEGDNRLVNPFLQHDLYMMGTDGLFFPDGVVHPRQFGSVGRFLGRLVREERLCSLEDAVYKLAGHAASRFGLVNRGRLEQGRYADVVVFDAETVIDAAKFGDPHHPTRGMEHVIVNGTPVIAEGTPLGNLGPEYPGRYLRYGRE